MPIIRSHLLAHPSRSRPRATASGNVSLIANAPRHPLVKNNLSSGPKAFRRRGLAGWIWDAANLCNERHGFFLKPRAFKAVIPVFRRNLVKNNVLAPAAIGPYK